MVSTCTIVITWLPSTVINILKTKVTLKSQISLMKINVKVSIFPFNFTACKPRAEESANKSSDS